MSATSISALLESLAAAREEVQYQSGKLTIAQNHENQLREQLHELMRESGTKTIEGHGLQLVRSNRKSITVTDEDALASYIDKQGMKPLYMTTPRFDAVRAKKDAVKNHWPGVEEVVTDVLSVKEPKP